jgi:hypothetical protein
LDKKPEEFRRGSVSMWNKSREQPERGFLSVD